MADTDSVWLDQARLNVVVGHFGTGKTEFSVNLALALARKGHKTTLADLDVVDPYFRSRERAALLAEHQVGLICSSQACMDADVPSLPPEVQALFLPQAGFGVLDIGGDPSGARVLARYRRGLREQRARVLCVVNGNRPLTNTPEGALDYIQKIQTAAGLPIDALVNNTHLCQLTQPQDILDGAQLVRQVSHAAGIPILCHVCPCGLAQDLPPMEEPLFPIQIYMKKPWE